MMSDLDRILIILSDQPAPAELANVEAPVMAGIARLRERRNARRAMVLAGFVAAFVGSASALVPTGPAVAEPLLGMPAARPHPLAG